LQEQQWVTASPDESNKRNRITYTITHTGEKAFQNWVEEEVEYEPIRQSEIARLFFGKYIPPERIKELLITYRQAAEARLSQFQKIEAMLQAQSEADADDTPYWITCVPRG